MSNGQRSITKNPTHTCCGQITHTSADDRTGSKVALCESRVSYPQGLTIKTTQFS